MKKPDPNEPRNKRLPFMASQSELDAIDEYRFTNRIPTRADAMRRLILAGLAAEEIHAPADPSITAAPPPFAETIAVALDTLPAKAAGDTEAQDDVPDTDPNRD